MVKLAIIQCVGLLLAPAGLAGQAAAASGDNLSSNKTSLAEPHMATALDQLKGETALQRAMLGEFNSGGRPSMQPEGESGKEIPKVSPPLRVRGGIPNVPDPYCASENCEKWPVMITDQFLPNEYFVAAVCPASNSLDCFHEKGREVAIRVGKEMSSTILSEAAKPYLSKLILRFPYALGPMKVGEILSKLTTETVDIVQKQLIAETQKLSPVSWDSEQVKNEKLKVIEANSLAINNWARDAKASATNYGGGWDWENDFAKEYRYKMNACQQLNRTLLRKDWYTTAFSRDKATMPLMVISNLQKQGLLGAEFTDINAQTLDTVLP